VNRYQPLTLFVVKQFYSYGTYCHSTGLKTSALFVVNMLLAEGHRAKLVEAVDGNSVDKLVSQNNPTKVVIEALWVTPAKLAQLKKLHPKVEWTVRIHSEISFLANEGTAFTWIPEYLKLGVQVAFNSEQSASDLFMVGPIGYLPNYYPLRKPRTLIPLAGRVDIGCFGAIRPLKNQLIQAVASAIYAKGRGLPLYFHMNGTRIEQLGNNNLKNITAFLASVGAHLVLHSWLSHDLFLELVSEMDICLQVSLSESFNIVSADAVSMGVPLIGSPSVSWLPARSQANPESAEAIAAAMESADRTTVIMNNDHLQRYLKKTVEIWNEWIA
jgi:hypothetical protein